MPAFSLSRSLERYVVPWTRRNWPLTWAEEFGREAPLGVELGFGNGAFLVEQARRYTEMNWLGVEMSWVSVQRLLRRHLFLQIGFQCIVINPIEHRHHDEQTQKQGQSDQHLVGR